MLSLQLAQSRCPGCLLGVAKLGLPSYSKHVSRASAPSQAFKPKACRRMAGGWQADALRGMLHLGLE